MDANAYTLQETRLKVTELNVLFVVVLLDCAALNKNTIFTQPPTHLHTYTHTSHRPDTDLTSPCPMPVKLRIRPGSERQVSILYIIILTRLEFKLKSPTCTLTDSATMSIFPKVVQGLPRRQKSSSKMAASVANQNCSFNYKWLPPMEATILKNPFSQSELFCYLQMAALRVRTAFRVGRRMLFLCNSSEALP